MGDGWIEFDRAVPYDLRLGWQPVVHAFAPTLEHSGFEGFTVMFPWSEPRNQSLVSAC